MKKIIIICTFKFQNQIQQLALNIYTTQQYETKMWYNMNQLISKKTLMKCIICIS